MSDVETAQQLLYLGLGLPGGYHVFERELAGTFNRTYVPTWAPVAKFQRACGCDDAEVSAAPHADRDGWTGQKASALWTPITAGKQFERLRFFQPRPSLVLQAGDTVKRWAIWLLERPLDADWVVELNRRIAHRLGAPKKLSSMDASLPTPGSVIRRGRNGNPLLVRPVELHEEFHSARAVAGRLPPAPDPDAWRER